MENTLAALDVFSLTRRFSRVAARDRCRRTHHPAKARR